jgi:hypothetical protein
MIVLCSAYMVAAVAGQNMYQCYLDDNQFNTLNMVPLDVSCKSLLFLSFVAIEYDNVTSYLAHYLSKLFQLLL